MHGLCKHYTSICCCNICWTHDAQCIDSISCFEHIQDLLSRGEARLTEDDFSDYISNNNDNSIMDKSIQGRKKKGRHLSQDNNITSPPIHTNRKINDNKRQRKTTDIDSGNKQNSYNRKRARTNEYYDKSLPSTSKLVGYIRDSSFVDQHVQPENETRNIPSGHNNTEHRLSENDLSRTNIGGLIPGNGNPQLHTIHDVDIGDEFGEATITDRKSTTTIQNTTISSPNDSYETQEDACYTFIIHKEELKPLPVPGIRKGPTFATFDHGDHFHFIFTTRHSNNLSRTITSILQYIGASFAIIAEAHTTLQRIRSLARFISYLISYELRSFNKYGSRIIKPLATITNELHKTPTTDNIDSKWKILPTLRDVHR